VKRRKATPPARVYLAESDPRQTADHLNFTFPLRETVIDLPCDSASLAREFGPWVRGDDGTWARRRRGG